MSTAHIFVNFSVIENLLNNINIKRKVTALGRILYQHASLSIPIDSSCSRANSLCLTAYRRLSISGKLAKLGWWLYENLTTLSKISIYALFVSTQRLSVMQELAWVRTFCAQNTRFTLFLVNKEYPFPKWKLPGTSNLRLPRTPLLPK